MPQPNMAALLPGLHGSPNGRVRVSADRQIRHAEASRGFQRDQFVFNVVQLRKPRAGWSIFKVHRYCLENVAAELFPGFPSVKIACPSARAQ
jgi:hypothetical protein